MYIYIYMHMYIYIYIYIYILIYINSYIYTCINLPKSSQTMDVPRQGVGGTLLSTYFQPSPTPC